MKYVGTYSDPKDIVTKDKLEAVASRVSTNEDNIAMAEGDIDGLQTDVGTLKTNVTSLQTALTGKQDVIVGAASTITEDNLATDRALVSNSSGNVAVSNVTSTELGYLDGVTSNVQTQLDKKLETAPVTSVNGATGEVKGTFYVTVTQGNGNDATADKTAAEVYAAYAAGYAVYAILKFRNGIVPYTLPLLAAVSVSGTVMLGFATIGSSNADANPQGLVVLYKGAAWSAWSDTLAKIQDIPTVPTELKNPYSLVIKIGNETTRYDGSAAKTVEIPKGVPSVTTADNGKFLRVVNGAWAAAAIGKSDVGLGSVDNVRQYSATNPPPYPVTSVNGKTGAVSLTASEFGAATTSDIYTALNRTNAVNVANSNYTTYMARGEALFSYENIPSANGCIAWKYE